MIFNLEALRQGLDKLYRDFSTYDGEKRDIDIEVSIENGDVSNDKLVDLIRMTAYSEHKGVKITRTIEIFTDKHEPELTVTKVTKIKVEKAT